MRNSVHDHYILATARAVIGLSVFYTAALLWAVAPTLLARGL